MKKTVKKLIAIAGAVAMLGCSMGALAACGGKNDTKPVPQTEPPSGDFGYTWDYEAGSYEETSAILYNNNLGEFYKYYTYAQQAKSLGERYALMAQAEAKLYQSGVLLPTSAQGGNYAVSKVAPYSGSSTLWGNDRDRLHYAIPCTTPITKEDRTAIKEYYNAEDNRDQSGEEYLTWLKDYLADNGYTTKNVYNRAYTSDPNTFDVLATSQNADSEPIIQTFDGLVEYDVKNKMQPALAESIPEAVASDPATNPTVTDDNDNPVTQNTVTYTFKIRSGIKWVDSQGRDVADLKASDFVTGFQHMLDAKGGLEYLVDGTIVGANEYMEGTADMSGVGVTADDTAMTVTYRVYEPASSYFLTMLSYSVFAPLSKSYFESLGGVLGEGYDPTCEYGTAFDKIAYCGPYRISEHTARSKMVFTKNDKWWNVNGTNARNTDTINWLFNDGTDATKIYTDFKSGTIDGCGLSSNNLVSAKADIVSGDPNVSGSKSIFDAYSYTSAMDATAYCMFYNMNRQAFSNFNDSTKGVSTQTSADAARTNAAMRNVHFRRALATGLNRETYMAHDVGTDLALTAISNMYTPGRFVQLPNAVNIQVGEEYKTYDAGTYYGQIVQDQLTADGMPITVFKEVDGEMSSYGFNGWFNETYAKSEMTLAVQELAAAATAVEVSASNPIVIDYPVLQTYTPYANRGAAVETQLEALFENKVDIRLVYCNDFTEWGCFGYYAGEGPLMNYDMYDDSGWGPDYGDPKTYLDTMMPDYSGYMTQMLGIF